MVTHAGGLVAALDEERANEREAATRRMVGDADLPDGVSGLLPVVQGTARAAGDDLLAAREGQGGADRRVDLALAHPAVLGTPGAGRDRRGDGEDHQEKAKGAHPILRREASYPDRPIIALSPPRSLSEYSDRLLGEAAGLTGRGCVSSRSRRSAGRPEAPG